MRPDYANGDLGFDPLGLRPEDPYEWLDMQNKEVRAAQPGGACLLSPTSLALALLTNGSPLLSASLNGPRARSSTMAASR